MIADTYMISSHENLGADVLNIIRKEAALSDSASLDMILLRMRENQAFRFITKEIIHEIILRLIEKNQVIEWGFKQFAPWIGNPFLNIKAMQFSIIICLLINVR